MDSTRGCQRALMPPSGRTLSDRSAGWEHEVVAVEDMFTELPVLHTARLWLRRITESDAEGLFEIFSDEEVTRYYAFDTFAHIDQARELAGHGVEQYQRREAMRWGLLLAGA